MDSINNNALKEYLRLKDDIEVKEHPYFGELIYNIKFLDIYIYSIELGKLFQKLSSELNTEIIFILDYSIPRLYQKNDYKPVDEALNYLREIGVTEDYVGAFSFRG